MDHFSKFLTPLPPCCPHCLWMLPNCTFFRFYTLQHYVLGFYELSQAARPNVLSCSCTSTRGKNNSFFPSLSISSSAAAATILPGCLLRSINELQVWAVSKKPSISRIFFLTYLHTYLESAGKVARGMILILIRFFYTIEISIFLQGMMAVIYTY